jgi:anti-sigma-K factor RskA
MHRQRDKARPWARCSKVKLNSQALIDHLASHYALGQLSTRTTRRFEAYARDRSDIRAAIAEWQDRVHALAISVPAQSPDPKLWARIELRLFGAQIDQRLVSWWAQWVRSLAMPIKLLAAGALGAVLSVLTLNFVLPKPNSTDVAALKRDALPQSYVGLLLDSKDTATLLASSLRHGKTLTVKLLKPLPVDPKQQYRLWAMPNEGAPFTLGLVPTTGSTALALGNTSEKLLSKVQRLVVFSEPAGSAPINGVAPIGTPILAGHCVKLW